MSHQKYKSAVFEYFSLTADGKYYVCQCQKGTDDQEKICDAKISAFSGEGSNAPTRAGNLKCHLQRHHPKDYKIVNEKDDERKKKADDNSSTSSRQTTVTKYFMSEKVTVTMTADKFKACIIEMVVKNSLPLTFFSTPAFANLNGEMANILGISLERGNIRNMIMEESQKQKHALKECLRGRILFLKMDSCTRHRVNYFAINIRFIDDKKVVVTRTLAVRDTKAQHTSDYLEKLLMDVLNDFNIRKDQVLSIVTDNASNMVKTLEKFNKKEVVEDSEDSDDYVDDYSEDNEQVMVVDDHDSHDTLDSFVDTAARISKIHHMRCSVHTLQLAIRDGLKGQHAANLIGRIRKVAVAARTPKLDSILKRRAGKGAILDQATRWGSTYMMIQRILEIKPFLSDMASPDVIMTEAQWDQVKQLEGLLRHPYNVTKKLQSDDLTPGLFYKEWKTLIFRLSQTGGILADDIRNSMIQREKLLLDNDILLAAIYVDAMYRVTLTEAQQIRAKAALCDVAIHIEGLRDHGHDESEAVVGPLHGSHTISSSSSNSGSDEELDFEKHLDRQERSKRRRLELEQEEHPQSALDKFKINFYKSLEEVEKIDHSSKLTVKEAIAKYPKIVQDASMTVTALPPTQISVERLFSALKIIRSDLRASLKEDLMEAILFLRTNSV